MRTRSLLLLIAAALLSFSLPAPASETDSRIESTARETYVFKTYLAGDDITIRSDNGHVTLSGTVSDESHLALAEETVASLPGVVKVTNELQVRGERPAAASDAWIHMKVKTMLLLRSNVSGTGTDVDVRDGVVTLRGEADSMAQKELATEYVKDIEGVTEVNNAMTVAGSPARKRSLGDTIDDASITAQVKIALLTHRSTSAMGTKVETRDGVVTLRGTAANDAERSLVTKLVRDINGVRDVDNKMVVGEPK